MSVVRAFGLHGLYAIVDTDVLARRGLDPLRFAEAVLSAQPAALQLRAKAAETDAVIALLRALRPLCTRAGVPLVANDRPDLALLANADMVHVGQDDASPTLVRTLAPNLVIGISTHTPEQLNHALHAVPAYIAFGPVWSTTSKALPDPVVGVRGLKQAAQLVRHHERTTGFAPPLVAIGGITLERVAEIATYAAAVAVISDLVPPRDLDGASAYEYVRARAIHFNNALDDPTRLDRLSLPEVS
jgi:thiamine-phosphate pyrophosphorylase